MEHELTSPDPGDGRKIYFTDPSGLMIDTEVQRSRRHPKDPARWDPTVEHIIEHGWDPLQAGAIEITVRGGHSWVGKGQGRTIAAQILNVPSVLVIEMPFLETSEIALSSFLEVKTTRKHTPFQTHQLALTAEIPEDVAIAEVASRSGLLVERGSGGNAVAIGIAKRLYQAQTERYPERGDLLTRVLSVSNALYRHGRDPAARKSDILHALGDLVRLEDACEWTYTPQEFADRILSEKDMEDWMRKFAANTEYKPAFRRVVGTRWRETWNKGRQTRIFPPLPWERA